MARSSTRTRSSARNAPAGRPRPASGATDPVPTPPPAPRGAPGGFGPPVWAVITTGILAVLGTALSSYLTYVHYSGNLKALHCTLGKFDCEKVVTSSYSVIFGIPVPVYGLAFFVGMLVLCSPPAWRSGWPLLMWARLAACLVGIGMIVWLIYVELYRLDTICPWCTSVHAVTFVMFVVVAVATARMQTNRDLA